MLSRHLEVRPRLAVALNLGGRVLACEVPVVVVRDDGADGDEPLAKEPVERLRTSRENDQTRA